MPYEAIQCPNCRSIDVRLVDAARGAYACTHCVTTFSWQSSEPEPQNDYESRLASAEELMTTLFSSPNRGNNAELATARELYSSLSRENPTDWRPRCGLLKVATRGFNDLSVSASLDEQVSTVMRLVRAKNPERESEIARIIADYNRRRELARLLREREELRESLAETEAVIRKTRRFPIYAGIAALVGALLMLLGRLFIGGVSFELGLGLFAVALMSGALVMISNSNARSGISESRERLAQISAEIESLGG